MNANEESSLREDDTDDSESLVSNEDAASYQGQGNEEPLSPCSNVPSSPETSNGAAPLAGREGPTTPEDLNETASSDNINEPVSPNVKTSSFLANIKNFNKLKEDHEPISPNDFIEASSEEPSLPEDRFNQTSQSDNDHSSFVNKGVHSPSPESIERTGFSHIGQRHITTSSLKECHSPCSDLDASQPSEIHLTSQTLTTIKKENEDISIDKENKPESPEEKNIGLLDELNNDDNSQISEGSFICNDDEEEEDEYEKVSDEEESKSFEIQSLNGDDDDDSPKSPEPEAFDSKVRGAPLRTVDALDGELDFEADDKEEMEERHKRSKGLLKDDIEDVSEEEEEEDLEEGEVKEDEDEVGRPKSPPQSICRFYSQGHCTWGPSCRFYHPPAPSDKAAITNKRGNYSMFEPPKPLVPQPPPRDYGVPTLVESAWERGVQSAKELVKAASKRKEQSPEFEDKCLNLTLTNNEMLLPYDQKSYLKNYDLRDYWPDSFGTADAKKHRDILELDDSPPSFGRGDKLRPKGRASTPERYFKHRANNEASRRPDEWHDPWRRSKSPIGKHSSSHDSDDSRSSSRSNSRSSSCSRSASSLSTSPSRSLTRSPSRSPPRKTSSKSSREPKTALHRHGRRKLPSKTSSRSHSSISSQSSYSSSYSGSGSRSPSPSPGPRHKSRTPERVPHLDGLDSRGLPSEKLSKRIKLNLIYDKNSNGITKSEADKKSSASKSKPSKEKEPRKRPATVLDSAPPGSASSSRREELLKQLKAVEDAIARKRSKN